MELRNWSGSTFDLPLIDTVHWDDKVAKDQQGFRPTAARLQLRGALTVCTTHVVGPEHSGADGLGSVT